MVSDPPDFGPSGYLPPRAAKRARKLILREPMGLQWAIAATAAGVLVLVAGLVLLYARSGPPAAPFVPLGPLSSMDARGVTRLPVDGDREVLVLRGAGGVTVLDAPTVPVRWCPATSRLLADDGSAVWEADGRLVGGDGGASLARLPSEVHDGVVYADVTAPGTRRPPQPRGEQPACDP